MFRPPFTRILVLLGLLVGPLSGTVVAADTLVVYSARNEQLIKPIFDAYTRETGVEIRFTTGDAAVLIERLAAEGRNSPADILMTVDAGELWNAAQRGLLRPVQSRTLERNIPAHLRDPQHRWFGLSQRARTIFYSPARVDPKQLSTYEALKKAEHIVRGWVANLATDVFANDTQLLEAIAAGQCDVGIANTYYFGRIVKERPDFPVRVFWANQGAGGTHVNVSGAGVAQHSRNAMAAIRFLEWLSSDTAQAHFAAVNMEFPANPAAPIDPVVASWGRFKASPINVAEAGRLQPAAVRLMDRAGYR